jgi:holliday junction DNA helicase RuvA
MYSYFKGKIIEKNLATSSLVIDVSNVGYQVEISQKSLIKLNLGEDYTIYIMAINNDEGIRLFGFVSKVEKELFQMLIKVSGIGPKSAINILNSFEIVN